MDYIFKNQFLEFDQKNKNKNYQYYHWAQKKRIEKQKQQYEQFRKMWFQIEQDEEKDKQKSKIKTNQPNQKKNTIKPEQLYLKNLQWKQGVQSKLEKKRQEKREEKERQLQLLRQSKYKEPKLLKDYEHKGPIKAWQERFDNYLRAKGGEELNENQNEFHPKIDQNSRRITKQMIGKVEDRLIEYGQKLKQKKIEMETIYQQQLHAQRNIINNQSIQSQISDVYWRLYKDGERLNQKRNQQKSQYSFTPEINQYSLEIASRITQKRAPLYQSKLINSKIQPDQKKQLKEKKGSEKGFNDFLKRNQALLSKIQKNRLKKMEILREKQSKQIKECTFVPQLNPRSLKMFANHNVSITQSNERIENLSKIQMNAPIDEESQQKKLAMVKSQQDPINNSSQKLARSTQRIERLHSDGNLNVLSEPSNLFIEDLDSISNLQQNKKRSRNESPHSINISVSNKYHSHDSDLFATERPNEKAPIYNIHEQLEEDSIQRQRDNDWEKELNLMQEQIQAMMLRTHY